MLEGKHLKGRNKWYKNFYDLTAFAYDLVVGLGDSLRINTEGIVRENYISKLEISPGDMVLETAIGTGSNLKFLPDHGKYFGVDISWQMLKFDDNSFDLVFHMGGLQFYSDPNNGIIEMARVAKPNTRIHILDEISGAGRVISRLLNLSPASPKYFSPVENMKLLVPKNMKDVSSKPIPKTHFYTLSFKKP
jgi:ubiquinone/menaquinone biosynthesis C-methylase UbiE